MAYKYKKDQQAAAKKHYLLRKDTYKKRAIIHKKKKIAMTKELLLNYLLKHPCVDCGETDPVVLEFDHVRGVKRGNIGNMRVLGLSLNTIITEIEKCEVRCANCHRRVTTQRRLTKKVI